LCASLYLLTPAHPLFAARVLDAASLAAAMRHSSANAVQWKMAMGKPA
jgi:hypothetical protein